jgi:broad specificity phosphatase PhoE
VRTAATIGQGDRVNGWETVFLARHGQTEWNLERRRQGRLDSALTDEGVAQARRHASALRDSGIDGIFVSPIGRAARALDRVSRSPSRRPLLVSHEMIGRMLQRRLLGLDAQAALTRSHPQDVVFRIGPASRECHRV